MVFARRGPKRGFVVFSFFFFVPGDAEPPRNTVMTLTEVATKNRRRNQSLQGRTGIRVWRALRALGVSRILRIIGAAPRRPQQDALIDKPARSRPKPSYRITLTLAIDSPIPVDRRAA